MSLRSEHMSDVFLPASRMGQALSTAWAAQPLPARPPWEGPGHSHVFTSWLLGQFIIIVTSPLNSGLPEGGALCPIKYWALSQLWEGMLPALTEHTEPAVPLVQSQDKTVHGCPCVASEKSLSLEWGFRTQLDSQCSRLGDIFTLTSVPTTALSGDGYRKALH